jgi:hypothetical protein
VLLAKFLADEVVAVKYTPVAIRLAGGVDFTFTVENRSCRNGLTYYRMQDLLYPPAITVFPVLIRRLSLRLR